MPAARYALILITAIGFGQDLDRRDKVYYPGDTERLKPLARKLGANIWLDQREIWTSPFRATKRQKALWIGFTAGTAALIASDHWTSTQLRNSRGDVAWGGRISKIGASYTLIPLTAGFYGYGVLTDEPKARETGVLGTEVLLDGLVVVGILKFAAGRNRPDAPNDRGEFFSGGSSFPSGHSIESWALASVIAHEYRNSRFTPILAYGLAAVVSSARLAAQKHYASDIVAGGAMGWFIGRYVYNTHKDHELHRHSVLRPQVVPRIDPGRREFSIALQFSTP